MTDLWVCGKRVGIEDLDPGTAIAIFGEPLYLSWLESQKDPQPKKGSYVVTELDRDAGMVIMSFEEALDGQG